MVFEEVAFVAVLVAYAIYVAFRVRAHARIDAREQAAFEAAVEANHGLEFNRLRIDQLAARTELLVAISCFGVFVGSCLDVPWLGNFAAAAAYFLLARTAMRGVQRTASRIAALLLAALALGFGAVTLLQSPEWPSRQPEWRYAVYLATLALFPGFEALKLTYRHHRLRAGAQRSAARRGV